MSKNKLKPCPFCGNNAAGGLEYNFTKKKSQYKVNCTKCNATMTYRNKKAAEEAWNRRKGTITVNNYGNGEQIKNDGHITINLGGK